MAGMPSCTTYEAPQRTQHGPGRRKAPEQRGQARRSSASASSSSEDGIDERRQRLDPRRHHQHQAGPAEEHQQGNQPFAPGLAAPEPAGSVDDRRTGAAHHDQRAGQAGTSLDHAIASSGTVRAARLFAATTGPQTSTSMPQRRKQEYASAAVLTIGSPARLKLVLSSTGTPVRRPISESSAWKRGDIVRSTTWT